MKRAVEEDPAARATLRAAIVENPRAVWEQRRLDRTVIMMASLRNCILVFVIGCMASSDSLRNGTRNVMQSERERNDKSQKLHFSCLKRYDT